MQDVQAERQFYEQLFRQNPDNEHITDGYEELHRWALPTPPEGLVLDVGCGTGAHAVRLARRGCSVLAIDLTQAGVRETRRRFSRENLAGLFAVAQAEHLPLRDRAVTVSWSALLLHHFPNLGRITTELARVSRDRIAVFEPNAHNLLTWCAFNVVNRFWGLQTTTRNQRALRPRTLVSYLRPLGFRPTNVRYVHRAWLDDSPTVGLVRRAYDRVASHLPARLRANKFFMVFDRDVP